MEINNNGRDSAGEEKYFLMWPRVVIACNNHDEEVDIDDDCQIYIYIYIFSLERSSFFEEFLRIYDVLNQRSTSLSRDLCSCTVYCYYVYRVLAQDHSLLWISFEFECSLFFSYPIYNRIIYTSNTLRFVSRFY